MKLAQILSNFKQPIPRNMISTRKQGGTEISFISWSDYADLLDQRAGLGSWSFSIKDIRETSSTSHIKGADPKGESYCKNINARLVVIGELTIFGDDRTITFSATGEELLNCNGYGDPASNASAMALRRACALAGLSRELWQK